MHRRGDWFMRACCSCPRWTRCEQALTQLRADPMFSRSTVSQTA